jgi:hypothetical protein
MSNAGQLIGIQQSQSRNIGPGHQGSSPSHGLNACIVMVRYTTGLLIDDIVRASLK